MAITDNVVKNMEYYQYAREVPKEAQKEFKAAGGFSGTDINPMWRIRMLTEMFGPAGIGWYTDVLSERAESHDDNTTMAIVDINLYVKVDGEWSKPIYGTGGNLLKSQNKYGTVVSDEGYKKAYTDALSVACKALGIGANIYFAKDTTKYTDFGATESVSPATVRAAKAEPKVMTAVVEPVSDGEITSEVLIHFIDDIVSGMTREQKKEVANDIKAVNNGSASYRQITDASIRKAVYDALSAKYGKSA